MHDATATVDGTSMRWLEEGSGPPVVLVHGIPTGPALWRHVVALLGDARCLAFEMVGYADSIPEGEGRDISVAAQAGYLLAWLRHLGVGRAVLVGHDLGGGVAQIAAVREPARCAGLVLTNAISYDSWPIPSVKAVRATGPAVARLPATAFRRVHAAFLRLGHDDGRCAAEAAAVHWPPYARHGGAAAFVRQVRSLDVNDTLAVAPQLPDLHVPARIVWGAADRFQEVEYGERLARDLGAPLRRLDTAKHFVPEDHAAEVARAVREVLEEAAP